MYRKHIGHLVIVGLNIFLNLDNDLSYHLLLTVAAAAAFFKLFFTEFLYHTSGLWLKGKTALMTIKEYANDNKAPEEENEELAFHIHTFKSFLQKDIWLWRMNKSA